MYSTCLFCTKDLGTNEVIETLPIGRRLAFDAVQGRLWVVCRHCAKWNLVPFESRLESIDACERLFRDTPTRYSTDNIGLARVREGLELVRIGPAQRPEFAGWRYGEAMRRRRRRNLALSTVALAAGGAGYFALGTLGGVSGALMSTGLMQITLSGLLFQGSRVVVADPTTGRRQSFAMSALSGTRLVMREDGPLLRASSLVGLRQTVVEWHGDDVARVGRRFLGSINALSGSHRSLMSAAGLLGSHQGDLSSWLDPARRREMRWEISTEGRAPVARSHGMHWYGYGDPMLHVALLPPEHRLALEMYFAESAERTYLEGELTLLEREWRQAEQLAKIADGLALE
jgi:hypothetical protein